MADNAVSMISTRWNNAFVDYVAATTAKAAVNDHPPGSVRDNIVELAREATDRVYRIPAPTLGGVRRKLELHWSDLFDETFEAEAKQIIVGDLTRLELLLADIDPYEASGRTDLDKVAADFSEAASEYDHYVQLHRDGPSDAWGSSSSSDIRTLIDEAEAKLLSLWAPNLGAVEKKLTVIFHDDGFCEVGDSYAQALILRDLRRFIAKHQH